VIAKEVGEPSALPPVARRAEVLWSLLLQAGGSGATFVIAFVISHTLGLVAQGQFGILKSWTDVLVTTFMFGLPQGLMHYSYHAQADMAGLRYLVHRYVLVVAGAACAAAVISAFLGYGAIAIVVLSVPGLVFHGLLRSLLLRGGRLIPYAIVTITPSVFLLVGVVALIAAESVRWQLSIVTSSLASFALVLVVSSWLKLPPAKRADALPQGLWSASVHNFVFNVCVAAQPALLLTFLSAIGSDASQLGTLALSFYFLQIFSVFAGFLAPAVYDRFAAGSSISSVWARDRHRILRSAILGVVVLVLALVAMPWIFTLAFPRSYVVAIDTCRVMVAAGFLVLVTRLVATVLLVAGRFADMSRQALARVILSLLFAYLLHHVLAVEAPLAAAFSVLVSEALVVLWGLWELRTVVRSTVSVSVEGAPK
jgi:O-antigen/teichoic acid export membrane protein